MNDRAEHDRLIASLAAYDRHVICAFEATGNYHRPLAWRLIEQRAFGCAPAEKAALGLRGYAGPALSDCQPFLAVEAVDEDLAGTLALPYHFTAALSIASAGWLRRYLFTHSRSGLSNPELSSASQTSGLLLGSKHISQQKQRDFLGRISASRQRKT